MSATAITISSTAKLSSADGKKIVRDSNGYLHAIYIKASTGIYYAKSTDNGATWSGETELASLSTNYSNIAIVIDSNDKIWCFWRKSDSVVIYYKTYSGGSWSDATYLYNESGSPYGSSSIYATVDSNNYVYVVSTARSNSQPQDFYIYKYVSSWSKLDNLTKSGYGGSKGSIAIGSNGYIYVAYKYYENSSSRGIQVDRSTDGGSNFSSWYRTNEDDVRDPVVVIDSSNNVKLFYVKLGTNNTDQIVYSTGSTPTELTAFSSNTFVQFDVSLDKSNNINVIYSVYISANNYKLYRLLYNGSWQSPEELLSSTNQYVNLACVWSNYPVVSSLKSNVPTVGYCLMAYISGTGVVYIYSSDLSWASPVVAPTVTTQDATSVDKTTATGNGNITNTGGENCDKRGICYKQGTSGDPTTSDSVSYDDGDFGTGAFTKSITGLTPNTTYRVRAYAVNSAGTGYGDTVSMTTDQSGRFFLFFQ